MEVTVSVALPPKHNTPVADAVAESTTGWAIVSAVEVVQLFASVTTIVYEPAIRFVNTFEPWLAPPLMLY